MGDSSFAFLRALNKFIENKLRAFVLIDGTVTKVNDNFTVDILINEVTFSGVPVKVLIGSQASIYEVPVIETACLVRFIDGFRGLPIIDSFDKVDKYYISPVTELFISSPKIQFNDGSNGGLVLVKSLVTRMNLLEQAFNTHVHSGVTTGTGVSAISTIQVTETTANEIQSTVITQ